MKIAFFHHSLRLGSGIDTVIYELANRVAKKGAKVTVLCFKSTYPQDECEFTLREIKSSLSVDTSQRKRFAISPFLLDLNSSFKSELRDFDVINTQLYPANFLVRNVRGPLKIVTEWSAGDVKVFSSVVERLYYMWMKYANKKAAKSADVLLAPCEFVSRWIASSYGIKPITMFLDGINFDTFDRHKSNPDRFFSSHPTLEGKKIILFVGRITDSKNIHSLIEAFDYVRKMNPEVSLVLVGDYDHYPAYYLKLNQLIKSRRLEGHIIFAGIVPWQDLPSYYSACTLYATCSLWEGFLRAEAFAYGKPIVCFDIAGNSETVKNGINGFLVKPADIEGFGLRMFQLIEDQQLCILLGENGYKWAKENLDFDRIAERFIALCRNLIDSPANHQYFRRQPITDGLPNNNKSPSVKVG